MKKLGMNKERAVLLFEGIKKKMEHGWMTNDI